MKKVFILFFLLISFLASAKTYYVSPTGKDSNQGTEAEPRLTFGPWLTWGKAFHTARAGDTVFFRGGTYYTEVTNGQGIRYIPPTLGNDGTADNWIVYINYKDEIPILDCSASEATFDGKFNYGINLVGVDYVHIKGLKVKNVFQRPGKNDLCVAFSTEKCEHLKLENMDVGYSGGQLFQLSNSHYLEVINCDAHNGCDTIHPTLPGGWSSGFSSPNYEFENGYMYFYGCRAWNCSDQGFAAGGPASLTVYEKCWSFNNGDEVFPGGDGHGFKLGYWDYESKTEPVIIAKNCLGVNNKRDGFSGNEHSNDYVGVYYLYNNMAYNNGRAGFIGYNTASSDAQELKRTLRNNISYKSGFYEVYINLYTHSNNTWDGGGTVSDADFVVGGLDVSWLQLPRKPDGSLPDVAFGKLATNSDLKDAGTDVGIKFYGPNPDLGWFESSTTSTGNEYPIVSISSPLNNSSFTAPATITIEALASDPDGSIQKVEFFNNGTSVGVSTSAPYSYKLTIPVAGTYSITAVATDNNNDVATSAAVIISVYVNLEPEVPGQYQLNLYPNPNNGQFKIDQLASSEGDKIIIYNSIGHPVYNGSITSGEFSKEYNLQGLLSGTYILVIMSANKIVATKTFTIR